MCGIACLVDYNNSITVDEFSTYIDAVAHRGPDDRGIHLFDSTSGLSNCDNDSFFIGLGHRRLSILDLSEAGKQPMFSEDNNYAIVYNGEIYNYIELRAELEGKGYTFRSDCDTEVLLAAYLAWGDDCVKRFNGMWSFIILDRVRRNLFISRDRIGIKPLYYYLDHKKLLFSSEIKQILTLKKIDVRPNRKVCLSYLATGYEQAPETFFENIFAFPAGHTANILLDNPLVNPIRFWHPDQISAVTESYNTSIQKIQDAFSNAVKLRLRSDVPVGGCLSGGLDSSSIFVEMKAQASSQTFSAFSSCFDDPLIDERPFMQSVVEKTNSTHHQVFPDADQLMNDLDLFLLQHDEPVGSISMFAQFKVMEKARQQKIPVLLDGQGGDELFSGYWPAYLLMLNNFKNNKQFFSIINHLLGSLLPSGNIELLKNIYSHLFEYRKRSTVKLPFTIKQELIQNIGIPQWYREAQRLSPEEYRRAEILKVHLPRLLKWEDRNSMAFSIESRVPFLDVNLIETILSIPPQSNIHAGWNKYLFRKAMNGRLPDNICWRKDKKGFETPQERWMKEGLFHQFLLAWSLKSEHPVSDYISTPFSEIKQTLEEGNFDSTAMFRLYCLDYWLTHLAK